MILACCNIFQFKVVWTLNILRVTLIEIIQPLLALKFQLSDKSIMYMKDERSNLSTLEGPLSTKFQDFGIRFVICKYLLWSHDVQSMLLNEGNVHQNCIGCVAKDDHMD